jgi:hypothetical protein
VDPDEETDEIQLRQVQAAERVGDRDGNKQRGADPDSASPAPPQRYATIEFG